LIAMTAPTGGGVRQTDIFEDATGFSRRSDWRRLRHHVAAARTHIATAGAHAVAVGRSPILNRSLAAAF
jgi:hypothetical protein